MDADSSYGGSDTAQDSTCGNESNSLESTTITSHSESPKQEKLVSKINVNTEEIPYKNEIAVNVDETDYKKSPNLPHYLTTANLNINETLEHHSNLEAMSKQYRSTSYLNAETPPSHRKSGLDNPGFDEDVDDADRRTDNKNMTTFDQSKPQNGDLNGKNDEPLTEAVNLELINMKPSGKDVTGPYENGKNGMTSIPMKPDADVEMGNPYDEYFVPVNEHKKYMSKFRKDRNSVSFAESLATASGYDDEDNGSGVIQYPEWISSQHPRGEKLYVTMDKRNVKKKSRCLCWGVCVSIVLAAVIVGILAAVGVIGTKPVQEVTSRQFSGNPEIKQGGIFGLPPELENASPTEETSPKYTPGPPVSTAAIPMTTEMSEISVPQALESQIRIDNLEFDPEYSDKNSSKFKELATSLENDLKQIIFTYDELNHGQADIEVKVMDFTEGSVVARYRIVWKFKEGLHNTKDPIDISMLDRRMTRRMAANNGFLSRYHVDEGALMNKTTRVLDSCKIQNFGCEHACIFDYKSAEFSCTCPDGKALMPDGKHCDVEPSAEPAPEPEPNAEPTPEPESSPVPEPTSKPEPSPEPEPTSKPEPSPEPEPTSKPEPSPEPEPTSKPEPSPEPEPTSKPEPSPEPEPEPEPEPNAEPQPTPKAEPSPTEPTTKPEPSSEPEPTTKPEPSPEPQPEPEPSTEYLVQSNPEPEPTVEPAAEPVSESNAEEITFKPPPDPNTERASRQESVMSTQVIVDSDKTTTSEHLLRIQMSTTEEPKTEPEPTSEPVSEPEPTSEPVSEPVNTVRSETKSPVISQTTIGLQPAPEPTSEPVSEPEPTSEPVSEPEPTSEPISEPSITSKAPSQKALDLVDSKSEVEPTAEPVAEPEPSSEPEPTPEPISEPVPASKVEATTESISVPVKTDLPKDESLETTSAPKLELGTTTESLVSPNAELKDQQMITESVPSQSTESSPQQSSNEVTTEPIASSSTGTTGSSITTLMPSMSTQDLNVKNSDNTEVTTNVPIANLTQESQVTINPNLFVGNLTEEATTENQSEVIGITNGTLMAKSEKIINGPDQIPQQTTARDVEDLTEKTSKPSETHPNGLMTESVEYLNNLDNMSPFLPDIENDTFVNSLRSDEHFVDNIMNDDHVITTKPPRLDNDQMNKTNPLDPNPTDAVLIGKNISATIKKAEDSTENTTFFAPPVTEKLIPEILNNVHSNNFFEKFDQALNETEETTTIDREITALEDVTNSGTNDISSTEDLIAMETTTNGLRNSEKSLEVKSRSLKHQDENTKNVVNDQELNNEFEDNYQSYAVQETVAEQTTTPKLFLAKNLLQNEDKESNSLDDIFNEHTKDKIVVTTEQTATTTLINDKYLVKKLRLDEPLLTTLNEVPTSPTDEVKPVTEGYTFKGFSRCELDQFQCSDGTNANGNYCIPIGDRCDSVEDCSDGSDEKNCNEEKCANNFQCTSGQCLKRHLVCDGIVNCNDGSDEINCESWNCSSNEFSCGLNDRCIPISWRCDGRSQCRNGSDEYNCNVEECTRDQFHCSGQDTCIPKTWRCDGETDCMNAEDETNCDCGPEEFKCKMGGGCVKFAEICNGVADCLDKSDEWNCLTQDSSILKVNKNNGTAFICSNNWNSSFSDMACNTMGFDGALEYKEIDKPAEGSLLKIRDNSEFSSSILNYLEETSGCEKIISVECQKNVCGIDSHIMDKENVQWPSLSILLNKMHNKQCTSSLISPTFAIASFSCVVGMQESSASEWTLKIDNQQSNVMEIIQHPKVKYSNFFYTNDVVLLKLEHPVQITNNVKSICLSNEKIRDSQNCIVTGWKKVTATEVGNNQYLKNLTQPFVSIQECNATKHYNGMMRMDEICVESNEPESLPCYDDAGAPLICLSEETKKWELKGLLSHSNCGGSSQPLIYTGINDKLAMWIKNIIGPAIMKSA